ncbi:MAG: transposase, partial [Hungatella sp.]
RACMRFYGDESISYYTAHSSKNLGSLLEDDICQGCPHAEKCKKTEKNRTVRINAELSSMHQEVMDNLQSIHGALLRMNRSIQAEGTFGIMKYDRWYKRIVRRGLDSVRLELLLVSIGYNLYKYHNKQMKRIEWG